MRKGALAAAAFLLPLFVWACGGGGDLAGPEGADQLTQPLFAATTSTQQTFVEFVSSPLYNDCTGEDVIFHVQVHVVDHVTEDAAGGLHINGSANFQGSYGVGQTSGLMYRLVARSGFGFNGPYNVTNGAEVGVFVFRQRWVSQGSGDNLAILAHITLIFNANGELTAYKFELPPDQCQG